MELTPNLDKPEPKRENYEQRMMNKNFLHITAY
jgi:hypothetical protein